MSSEDTEGLEESVADGRLKLNRRIGKVHPCTGTEALYRPYGP